MVQTLKLSIRAILIYFFDPLGFNVKIFACNELREKLVKSAPADGSLEAISSRLLNLITHICSKYKNLKYLNFS